MTTRKHLSKPFSGPKFTVLSFNSEGISSGKEALLSQLCREHNVDVVCLQETHRDKNQVRPKIQGMQLVAEIPHSKHGSAIFTKPETLILSTASTLKNGIEIITIELSNCTVTSVYKPPGSDFTFHEPANLRNQKVKFVIGDFNCHSTEWGYENTDDNGELLQHWADASELSLFHDSKLSPSFNSGRWKRGYNPDLIFVTNSITQHCSKTVCSPIPQSQHRPIMCQFHSAIRPQCVPFRRRYNFEKADWSNFSASLDTRVQNIEPIPEAYDQFIEAVKKSSCKSIPRGCRTNYIEGLNPDVISQLEEYYKLFEQNPMGEETIEAAHVLTSLIASSKRESWSKLMEELDMSRSSQKAWRLLKKLNRDPVVSNTHTEVTANQIAHQLLMNGKIKHEAKTKRPMWKLPSDRDEETSELTQNFTIIELENAIIKCKSGKAAGMDDIRVEQIKNFGKTTKEWLIKLYNNCLRTSNIPKMWRKARVIAVLKPGKDSRDPRNYRPISLLCHLYKIFERMLLNRLTQVVDQQLIPQQAGFRPNKSAVAQVLNLTQYIEDGFEKRQITGVAFIDLSAAYDTVNHRLLLQKIFTLTNDSKLTRMMSTLLQNRRFIVDFQGQQSKWRTQKNGLPQGSVLAPMLFNIYTNDQPLPNFTRSFIYADDLALACQDATFEEVELTLDSALKKLGTYYKANHLKPNPSKSQLCAFHLKNRDALRKLQVSWNGVLLEHTFTPKYLGVTLDRSLTFKTHCLNVKRKVSARNNVLRKLRGTNWGAKPQVLRTTALALCYSAAEYASPVWYSSSHSKIVDPVLNEACRLITGCLKPTPVEKIYCLAGIAPPNIRREVAADLERLKAENAVAHPLFGQQQAQIRLKSRKSFLRSSKPLATPPDKARLSLWKSANHDWMEPREHLPPGYNEDWDVWKSLNRLRTGVGRAKSSLKSWGFSKDDSKCECGQEQTVNHMYQCPLCPFSCSEQDLLLANDNALGVARFWKNKI